MSRYAGNSGYGGGHHGGGRREYDDQRHARRSRSRSRDRERGIRSYDGGRGYDREDRREREHSAPQSPTSTVMIKGLPSHTTEPVLYSAIHAFAPAGIRLICYRDTGECKGFAFVNFGTPDRAQYFLTTFAGSCGDAKAPQLIIENRSTTLEFALDEADVRGRGGDQGRSQREPGEERGGDGYKKSDWLCEACGYQNFARRRECFKCAARYTSNCASVNSHGQNVTSDPLADSIVFSDIPSCSVAVKGFANNCTDDMLVDLFRQFAVVKSAYIIKENPLTTGQSAASIYGSVGLVEFHQIEHAQHAVQQCSATKIYLDKIVVKVNFLKSNFLENYTQAYNQQMYAQSLNQSYGMFQQQPAPAAAVSHNQYAAAALQAAQWSGNNGYAGNPLAQHPGAGAPETYEYDQQRNPAPAAPVAAPVPVVAPKSVHRWPPCFDTHGGSFNFQVQSGCFYEPLSEFYYCPKSKLYYNSVTGLYYSWSQSCPLGTTPTTEQCFESFVTPPPATPVSAGALESTAASVISTAAIVPPPTSKPVVISNSEVKIENTAGKKPASIAFGFGNRAGKGAGAKGVGGKTLATTEDMAKWMQKEKDADVVVSAAAVSMPLIVGGGGGFAIPQVEQKAPGSAPKDVPIESSVSVAVDVPAGEAVCLLCSRRFTSQEQLERHEKGSKLHAENLKKAAELAAPVAVVMRDRAAERRTLYGQSDNLPPPSPPRQTSRPVVEMRVAPVVSVTSDVHNPGSQMLRKLGWSEGEGLGQGSTGSVMAVGTLLEGQSGSRSVAGVGAATAPAPGGRGSSSYAVGSEYKQSIMQAARDRFQRDAK